MTSRRAYMKHRALMRERGLWKPHVEAEPARAHVRELREYGLSLAVIADLAGVTLRSLMYLMYGEPAAGKAPAVMMSAANASKLLEFWPTLEQMPDMVAVDAAGTKRRLQALIALGWSARALALRCGKPENEFIRVLGRQRILAVTARLVRDLYDELWNQPAPTASTGERISASHAHAMATRNRWPRPQDWDDELLDLTDAELKDEIRRRVQRMTPLELGRCQRAHREEGDRSPLIVAASAEYERYKVRRQKQRVTA
ncbi:hypothetical protein ACIBCT_20850 [Streptosporangium sp. NPDC050855]|uniref:hypothetical protein n=1 Tax=Streptosporangium sp. NPDC050855 TaxID=3366194 RepID=UPI0037A0C40E